jgi:hypothetical protein
MAFAVGVGTTPSLIVGDGNSESYPFGLLDPDFGPPCFNSSTVRDFNSQR